MANKDMTSNMNMNYTDGIDSKSIHNLKGSNLKYIQKGVLWVEKEPHYIVELIKEPDISYVMVYFVHPNTENNPQKLAQERNVKTNVFSNSTKLGKLANHIVPSKKAKKWVPKNPAFIAPVIPNQKATLTGKIESGFYEREPDTVSVEGGEKKMVRGRNTNVFIGLSSIVWEDKFTIPVTSILENIKGEQSDAFYDLEGYNNNLDNPLGTYYDHLDR